MMTAEAPSKAKSFPTFFIPYWRARLQRETIKQKLPLGLCSGHEATLSVIDRPRAKFDEADLEFTENAEEALLKISASAADAEMLANALSFSVPNVYSDMEETVLFTDIDSIFCQTRGVWRKKNKMTKNI